MKTVKTIITLFLFLFISNSVLAMRGYFKGDTIRYKFDHMLIEVASTDALQKGLDLQSHHGRIEQLKKVLGQMNIATPAADERVCVSFRDQGENMVVWNHNKIDLRHSKRNQKHLIVFEDGTTFEKEYGRFCIEFIYRAVVTKIYIDDFNDLSYIMSDEFKASAEKANAYLKANSYKNERKNLLYWMDLRNNTVKAYQQKGDSKNNDMIVISAGVGSGWVKNTFVSDINLKLGLGFGKKGINRNLYSVAWRMMYDFSSSSDQKFYELNHFVDFGWDHNFSNSRDEDKWYGFSLGFLAKRNNDFFKKNTFRVGINKRINNSIHVEPSLYFNDLFENVYPGIRFSFSF